MYDRPTIQPSRLQATKELLTHIQQYGVDDKSKVLLWKCICLFSGYPFVTSGHGKREGAKFNYEVSAPGGAGGRRYHGECVDGFGNELWIINNQGEKRKKRISRSSVDYALGIILEQRGVVKGPKQLRIYGASYVYAIFLQLGLISLPDKESLSDE